MITMENLLAIDKNDRENACASLSREEIAQLVDWLSLKDDKIRYKAFLLLQSRSMIAEDVYPYWDVFRSKLRSENSYQRSLGLMLLAENAKWDAENRMEKTIDAYLALLHDEKPITVRQCIQSLTKIVPYVADLNRKIADTLMSLDLAAVRETMRKLILLDILDTLLLIRKELPAEEIEQYILDALSGGLLDKKAKRQVEAKMLANGKGGESP